MECSFEDQNFIFDEVFLEKAIGLFGEVGPGLRAISMRFRHDIIKLIN